MWYRLVFTKYSIIDGYLFFLSVFNIWKFVIIRLWHRAQARDCKDDGCEFELYSRKLNVYLILYFHFSRPWEANQIINQLYAISRTQQSKQRETNVTTPHSRMERSLQNFHTAGFRDRQISHWAQHSGRCRRFLLGIYARERWHSSRLCAVSYSVSFAYQWHVRGF